jgi:hypothetical protein
MLKTPRSRNDSSAFTSMRWMTGVVGRTCGGCLTRMLTPLLEDARALVRALHQDGAPVDDDGKLVFGSAPPVLPVERFDRLDEPRVLLQHLERIDAGIQKDPAAAIGAAKELVESAGLAANSARAVVEFLLETWHSRREAESPTV